MRKILIDAHTHTVASGHAYSSLQEMAQAASDKGLQVLGITEHGPSIKGTCPLVYFRNMFVVPRHLYGVRILMGCEVNILDTEGRLDLNDEYLNRLDIAIAGIHEKCYQGGTKAENTAGMFNVIRNPKIHIISHPGDGTAELDFEPLVLAAKESHTLLEINNHSLAPQRNKAAARDNNLQLLRLCKKYTPEAAYFRKEGIKPAKAPQGFFVYNYGSAGIFRRLVPLLSETQFPDELIMNFWPDRFFEYLGLPNG